MQESITRKTRSPLLRRSPFVLPHLVWQAVFFAGPVAFLLLASFRHYQLGQPTRSLTLTNYRLLLFSSPFVGALVKTMLLASVVSVLATAIAFAAIIGAWSINNVRLRTLIIMGSALVFFAGVIPRTYVLEFLLSEQGPLVRIWSFVGTHMSAFVLYSTSGIIVAYLPLLLPLSIAILYVSRRDVPIVYIDAAVDLGASWLTIQRRIVLPSMKPGIVVSLILTFILVAGDVVVVDLIGGSQTYTASTQILDYVKIDDWGSAAAASVVLLAIIATAIAAGTTLVLRGRDTRL
jgi:ABC-type spermidine/putrescine transport system permease subunit I